MLKIGKTVKVLGEKKSIPNWLPPASIAYMMAKEFFT